jgi:hypothetical protein
VEDASQRAVALEAGGQFDQARSLKESISTKQVEMQRLHHEAVEYQQQADAYFQAAVQSEQDAESACLDAARLRQSAEQTHSSISAVKVHAMPYSLIIHLLQGISSWNCM